MRIREALAAALSAAACCAHAAELPVTRGEEVIVTATRFEERYVDRPVNATVITAEDIRASTATTVPELLSQQAGIHLHDFYGNHAAGATVDLRGFGITGTQNTLILLDGRRIADIDLSGVQWSAIPLAAIERIEIVRGAGGVLFGEGATAGVVNIITRSPAKIGNFARLEGRGASFGTREGQLHANYFSGNLGFNVIAANLVSGGYRNNNRNRQGNAQAELRLITERGEASFKIGNDNQGIRLPGARTVQPSAGLDQLATDRRGTSTPLDYAQRAGNRAAFDWRHETAVGQLSVGLGYRDKEQISYFDFGGFPDYRVAEVGVWALSPRVKLPQPIAGLPNTLIAGLDWYRWNYDLRLSNAPANIGRPFNTVNAAQETAAFYLQNTTRVGRGTTLVAGYRGERLRIEATDRFDPLAPGGAFGSGAPAASQKDREHAYELALRHEFAPGWAGTGRIGRSYRYANVDEIYEFSPLFAREFQFLRPQTARAREAGVEHRAGGAHWRATAFVIDVTDEIRLDPFSSGVGNTNLPPSRRRGFELEASGSPGASLRLALAYTYIEAKFRQGVLPGSAFTQQNVVVAGKTVPLVPRHKLNLNASWAIAGGTRLNADLAYVASQYMDNDEGNTLGVEVPAYALAGLKLVHAGGAWRFTAAVNNLFNTRYYNYAVRSQFVADRYNAYPLPGRAFAMTVEYDLR